MTTPERPEHAACRKRTPAEDIAVKTAEHRRAVVAEQSARRPQPLSAWRLGESGGTAAAR